MSRGVNKVILVGNLGNDPDIRFTPNGTCVANLSVATSEQWKDKNTGQPQQHTEWHRVAVFGKPAEILQQYAKKGTKLYVEGKLQTRKWQANDGTDRYSTEIVVNGFGGQVQLLSDNRNPQGQGAPAPQQNPANYPQGQQPQQARQAPVQQTQRPVQQAQPQHQQPVTRQAPQPMQRGGGFDNFDDDIPFDLIRHPYLS